jgi:probable rRNA maturation factor
MNLSINITLATKKWGRAFPRMRAKIEQAAALAVMRAKKPAALARRDCDLSILLTTDAKIRRLNRDFRGKDKPTNVLSFPQLPPPPKGPVPLGDVVLAAETIRRESRMQGKNIESHTIHLVVHGVLHLFGYDHMKAKDAKTMENLECDILAILGYDNPYHEHATAVEVSHG